MSGSLQKRRLLNLVSTSAAADWDAVVHGRVHQSLGKPSGGSASSSSDQILRAAITGRKLALFDHLIGGGNVIIFQTIYEMRAETELGFGMLRSAQGRRHDKMRIEKV